MRLTLSRYRFRNTFIAVGLAILGALLVLLYVSSYRDDVQSGAELVEVFVAARDIPEGTDGPSVAGSGYLRKESVLRRNVVRGAIAGSAQISDLAASQTILEGEQVTTRQFHPLAEQGVLASISGNRRAMTVPGDGDTLLSGIVNEGDRVDVLANVNYIIRQTGSTVSRGDLRRVASRVILRDLLVLRAPSGTSGDAIGSGEQSSITLAVTDRQAQKLLFAIKNGSFWLVLRPVSKPADSTESVETIESILGDGLGPRGIDQLTSGYGAGSISSSGG
jgi:Flp pilus assembly protein CpaB